MRHIAPDPNAKSITYANLGSHLRKPVSRTGPHSKAAPAAFGTERGLDGLFLGSSSCQGHSHSAFGTLGLVHRERALEQAQCPSHPRMGCTCPEPVQDTHAIQGF